MRRHGSGTHTIWCFVWISIPGSSGSRVVYSSLRLDGWIGFDDTFFVYDVDNWSKESEDSIEVDFCVVGLFRLWITSRRRAWGLLSSSFAAWLWNLDFMGGECGAWLWNLDFMGDGGGLWFGALSFDRMGGDAGGNDNSSLLSSTLAFGGLVLQWTHMRHQYGKNPTLDDLTYP